MATRATTSVAAFPAEVTPGTATPAAARNTFALPPKLLSDAAKRLAWLAGTVGILFIVVETFQQLAQPQLRPILQDPVNRLISLGCVLMAFGIVALHRFKLVTPRTLIALGMLFEILVAWALGIIETAYPFDPAAPVLGMSTVGPWILAFVVLIPNCPLWTLGTALVAASTWPAAYAFNYWRYDFDLPPWGTLAVWPTINYLLAIMAYAISRRTYGNEIAANSAEELGSYRLVSQIGAGGMGEVWRATHQMLARAAAIKLIKADVMTASSARQADVSVKRFRREANVIAELQSPHTVYIYDFGTAQDGRFYYVMELLDGVNLQELVAKFGPQPASRVVAILRQVCESLEEAHARGLVHRDLKPSNIMVCKLALKHDFVKVLDFGLAKFIGAGEASQLTMEGATAGTPAYLSPEVALGEADVDARSDIYALGCVAYFLLTGALVFPDSNPMSMALKHVQTTPVPPSQRTEVPVPADLERIVMQCLEKARDARPPSARHVSEMLASCQVPAWTGDDATQWWDRHLPATSSMRASASVTTHTPPVVRKA